MEEQQCAPGPGCVGWVGCMHDPAWKQPSSDWSSSTHSHSHSKQGLAFETAVACKSVTRIDLRSCVLFHVRTSDVPQACHICRAGSDARRLMRPAMRALSCSPRAGLKRGWTGTSQASWNGSARCAMTSCQRSSSRKRCANAAPARATTTGGADPCARSMSR